MKGAAIWLATRPPAGRRAITCSFQHKPAVLLVPLNHGDHHYRFKVYALNAKLPLTAGATKDDVLDAIQGHVLAEGELVGTYSR